MFYNYIRKILPIPIIEIKASKDGYKYLITTYSSVINEYNCEKIINKRISKNKKIQSISYWRLNPDNNLQKQAVIEFKKKGYV